jgi:hypothetical protein
MAAFAEAIELLAISKTVKPTAIRKVFALMIFLTRMGSQTLGRFPETHHLVENTPGVVSGSAILNRFLKPKRL